MEECGRTARSDGFAFDPFAGLSQAEGVALNKSMAALGRFLLENWPDEILFERMVRELVARVKGKERRVRAYGEMVALLWGRGHRGATARLEQLWHRLCRSEELALFCAYPQTALAEDSDNSVRKIRELHARVLAGRQLV